CALLRRRQPGIDLGQIDHWRLGPALARRHRGRDRHRSVRAQPSAGRAWRYHHADSDGGGADCRFFQQPAESGLCACLRRRSAGGAAGSEPDRLVGSGIWDCDLAVVMQTLIRTTLLALSLLAPWLAEADEPTLTIDISGRQQHLTRSQLLSDPTIANIEVAHDIAYGHAMTYRAIPLDKLLADFDLPHD